MPSQRDIDVSARRKVEIMRVRQKPMGDPLNEEERAALVRLGIEIPPEPGGDAAIAQRSRAAASRAAAPPVPPAPTK